MQPPFLGLSYRTRFSLEPSELALHSLSEASPIRSISPVVSSTYHLPPKQTFDNLKYLTHFDNDAIELLTLIPKIFDTFHQLIVEVGGAGSSHFLTNKT
jgi:hypothetical protein